MGWVLVEPMLDGAFGGEGKSLAAIGPAHVADADKIGSWQAVQHPNLCAEERGFSAKAHWANAQLVRGLDDIVFKFIELGVRVMVIELAQELLFGEFITRGSIAADANAENAWSTAFALSLQDGVEDGFAA